MTRGWWCSWCSWRMLPWCLLGRFNDSTLAYLRLRQQWICEGHDRALERSNADA